MERFLFERGESFVASLRSGQGMMFIAQELQDAAEQDVIRYPDTSSIRSNVVQLASESIERTLLRPSAPVQYYLRAIADGYTMFAFLRETPNVQSAVTKLFSNGEIWLDTSAALPMLAETLLESGERGYSRLVSAAQSSGVKFFVTSGVVEEMGSHLANALQAWANPSGWKSRTPFLLSAYIWSGAPSPDFSKWIENFRGSLRPFDDLASYLREELSIKVCDLGEYVDKVPQEVRWQAEHYWHEVHEKRRGSSGTPPDQDIIRLLAKHDVENFLGIIEKRHGEELGNPFGYSSWWLTLDRSAIGAAEEIASLSNLSRLDSPVMSFDFLTYYLAVGPARNQLERSRERQLPLAVDTSLIDGLPKDLLAAAERARHDIADQDDRVVKRRIRDYLELEKLGSSRIGRTGMDAIEDDIRISLEARAGRGR